VLNEGGAAGFEPPGVSVVRLRASVELAAAARASQAERVLPWRLADGQRLVLADVGERVDQCMRPLLSEFRCLR
jgi:hypothetical protein